MGTYSAQDPDVMNSNQPHIRAVPGVEQQQLNAYYRAPGSADSPDRFRFNFGWWNELKRTCSKQQMEVLAATLWSIWINRNSLIFNDASCPAAFVINEATLRLAEWKSANAIKPATVSTGIAAPVKWSRPLEGWLKCNTDASVSGSSRMGHGGIFRSADGEFVAAIQGSKSGYFSPLVAEAIGLREVLSWIKGKGLSRVEIGTDSQIIYQSMNSCSEDVSCVGLILDDCKALLKDLYQCRISFIRRSANVVTHSLARVSLSLSGPQVWEESCSAFILNVLAHDLI